MFNQKTQKIMDAKGFIRECYLRSVPSVDLDATTETIDCRNHKLSTSVYEEILNKYAKNNDEKFSANMWCVCSGPHLVND